MPSSCAPRSISPAAIIWTPLIRVLAAVLIAAEAGLRLPLVYNTGGYDALETLALLDGVVDVMPEDMGPEGLGEDWRKVYQEGAQELENGEEGLRRAVLLFQKAIHHFEAGKDKERV